MALQSLDIVRRSATTQPSPEARGAHTGQVAKLIDVSKCIGCKACQVACMEWNDLRPEIDPDRTAAERRKMAYETEHASHNIGLKPARSKSGPVTDFAELAGYRTSWPHGT